MPAACRNFPGGASKFFEFVTNYHTMETPPTYNSPPSASVLRHFAGDPALAGIPLAMPFFLFPIDFLFEPALAGEWSARLKGERGETGQVARVPSREEKRPGWTRASAIVW